MNKRYKFNKSGLIIFYPKYNNIMHDEFIYFEKSGRLVSRNIANTKNGVFLYKVIYYKAFSLNKIIYKYYDQNFDTIDKNQYYTLLTKMIYE